MRPHINACGTEVNSITVYHKMKYFVDHPYISLKLCEMSKVPLQVIFFQLNFHLEGEIKMTLRHTASSLKMKRKAANLFHRFLSFAVVLSLLCIIFLS